MFQIEVYGNDNAGGALNDLAMAIERYAESRGERSSSVVTALTGMIERLVVFEELRERFDVRR